MDCPLVNVQTRDDAEVQTERTAPGWHFATADGLTAGVRGFEGGVVCRTEAPPDRDVVQLGWGQATSRLCDSLYSPEQDTALRFNADGGSPGLDLHTHGDSPGKVNRLRNPGSSPLP